VVADDEGVVRGSNDPKQVGQKYAAPAAKLITNDDAEVAVRTHELSSGNVLDFEVPILFQKKPIGQVHLGIYEAPLTRVANLVYVLLAILTLVTVAAVAAGTFLLARRIAAPIRVIKSSLDELAHGRYDVRIGETRKDEFGELYAAFDKTAEALENRHDPATAPPHAAAPASDVPAVPAPH
jgi:methyl-accepting chemotaxis protein